VHLLLAGNVVEVCALARAL